MKLSVVSRFLASKTTISMSVSHRCRFDQNGNPTLIKFNPSAQFHSKPLSDWRPNFPIVRSFLSSVPLLHDGTPLVLQPRSVSEKPLFI
ncbi:hypothetical protein O6P43_025849 [Quillaja saponaria]|uniref:Uncharacterized protein n=1 Tax=Quillaja saponaria TaxID=32244 RepID=A0AAD7L9V9_QUISA|nr:hypothetical protein O6P43_025849 [Quillaja saponaria]